MKKNISKDYEDSHNPNLKLILWFFYVLAFITRGITLVNKSAKLYS